MWYNSVVDLEQQVADFSMKTVAVASVVLITATVLSIVLAKRLPKKKFKHLKLPLFLVMAGTIVLSTFVLAFNTVYLNVKAESKGPVHWHSDIEFWACGSEIELRDPTGLFSNKIGTSTYHEHNDKRIHLEGVVIDKERDASLSKFMEVTGGYITPDSVGIPINEDQTEWLASEEHKDGDKQDKRFQSQMGSYVGANKEGSILELGGERGAGSCNDKAASLQVFVYRYNKADKTYKQVKLNDPTSYVMRDESVVPPGDCVIVEFDVSKPKTDKVCNQYGVRDTERCQEFGVKDKNPELCNIRQVVEMGDY